MPRTPARVPVSRTTLRVKLRASDVELLLHPDGNISVCAFGDIIDLNVSEAREMIGRVLVHHSDLEIT